MKRRVWQDLSKTKGAAAPLDPLQSLLQVTEPSSLRRALRAALRAGSVTCWTRRLEHDNLSELSSRVCQIDHKCLLIDLLMNPEEPSLRRSWVKLNQAHLMTHDVLRRDSLYSRTQLFSP